MKDQGSIVHEGMGGFLCPPTHPEHNQSVCSRVGDRFSMCLSSAVDCDWLDEGTRNKAKEILDAWRKPPIADSDVQDWILQVLGYFRGCYKGLDGPEEWSVSNLKMDRSVDPVLNADQHAGVHLIRKYYPEFIPTDLHFKAAYWGMKPETIGA